MKWEDFVSIPKSLYFNLRYLPIKTAIHFPFLIRHNVKIGKIKRNSLCFHKECIHLRPGMIRIGFGDIGIKDMSYERTIIQNSGCIIFKGVTFLGQGARLSCGSNGKILFGNNFRNSGGLSLICEDNIIFGDNVLIGWDTSIIDCDFHKIINIQDNYISKDRNRLL